MRAPSSSNDADEDPDHRPGSDRQSASDHEPDSARTEASESGLAVRLAEGAKGGLVATLVMTAYRLPVSRSLPPTARFWSKFASGGDPDDHPVPAVALHLLYGTVAGAVFGSLAPMDASDSATDEAVTDEAVTDDARTDAATDDADETARLEAVGLLAGVGYALALSVFGERALLERLLDADLDSDERLVFHAGHVVYGLSLGTWVGSRTGDRR